MPRTKIINKVCKGCEKDYEAVNPLQQYCSYKCAFEYRTPPKPRKGSYSKCLVCGKDVYSRPSEKRKYCGYECKYKAEERRVRRVCVTCGKAFSRAKSLAKRATLRYCSVKCRNTGRVTKTPRSIDSLWAIVIKLRAGGRCEFCGTIPKGLNAHHIFSRSNQSVRWDVENGIALCALHHLLGNMSAHKAPLDFAEWLKETRGEVWYDRLRRRAKKVGKPDKEQVKTSLKEEELAITTGRQMVYACGPAPRSDIGWFEVEGDITQEEQDEKREVGRIGS